MNRYDLRALHVVVVDRIGGSDFGHKKGLLVDGLMNEEHPEVEVSGKLSIHKSRERQVPEDGWLKVCNKITPSAYNARESRAKK